MVISRRKRKSTNNLEKSNIIIRHFSSRDFKPLFKGSSYYYSHCADRQNEAHKSTDTDQKSCSYQIPELDIYFRTEQVGFFRWIIKPLSKNPNNIKAYIDSGEARNIFQICLGLLQCKSQRDTITASCFPGFHAKKIQTWDVQSSRYVL